MLVPVMRLNFFVKAVLIIIDKVVVIYVLLHRTSNNMFNQL